MQRVEFLGWPVDSLTMGEALDWMADCIRDGHPHTITAVNANKLWLMSKHERLAKFVRRSDLVIPEWAVVWGSERLGTPLKAHVGGVMLLKESLPWAEEHGYRPYFLGAKPEVVQTLAGRLQEDYPGLLLAGFHHGYLQTQLDIQRVRDLIRGSQPDLLFVAMGTPRQEYWIEENLPDLGVPVAMGVGGSFDVIAGIKPDAPDWVRGKGLEWLYRLRQEPGAYWQRYLVTNPWFVWQVVKARVAGRAVAT
jgi:N-acetylglucosaminyldiphosphoundecaprenol N-acetyl-beta-D-mannosaminyltransferase